MTFSGADRVGLGYVAGNYKGKVNALITFNDGTTEPEKFNTYSAYTEPVSGTMTALAVEEFDENFQEGDIDSSGAPNATQTFRAFRWIWEQDPALANKGGTICVNPRGLAGITGGSGMVSLDYFLVARGNKMAVRGIGTGFTNMTQSDVNATWNYNADNFRLPASAQSSTSENLLAPVNQANWDGFIPKISGVLSSQVTHATVLDIITHTKTTPTGVPQYWIVFNEEDNAQWFANGTQPTPDSGYYTKKDWATQYSGISNPEIWLVETSTNLPAPCGDGTIIAQRDLQKCNGKTQNVRNYVGGFRMHLPCKTSSTAGHGTLIVMAQQANALLSTRIDPMALIPR